jgi:hypothetical protein
MSAALQRDFRHIWPLMNVIPSTRLDNGVNCASDSPSILAMLLKHICSLGDVFDNFIQKTMIPGIHIFMNENVIPTIGVHEATLTNNLMLRQSNDSQ